MEEDEVTKREERTLAFWKERQIFEKTLEKPAPRGEFVFYEGPPTANGRPGLHHLGARAFKDVVLRYKTMRGFYVRRKAGWDAHGLPVEIETEKRLGLKSKKEIEAYGVAEFNQQCRESVWRYLAEWEKFTGRIGFWLDQKNPYITYRPEYIETLWWILKQVHERGLLYRDYKVLPWCPRCGTALSSHELAQGYAEVEDPAVYVKFELADEPGTFLLAWTTTPWTLPGNVALSVAPEVVYVKVEIQNSKLVLAKERLAAVLGEEEYEVIGEVSGKELLGKKYKPLFDFKELQNDKSHRVYPADFVSTDEGTGVVHTAVMYGVADFELGQKTGLPKRHLVAEDGTFTEGTPWQGKFVKAADQEIIADLEKRSLLFRQETIRHTYPFCWRCESPVIYYARDSWFIKMSVLRGELVKENQKINWEPAHIRDGRFGEWLREVKDWAVSRERYWGTPLPVWQKNEGGEPVVIGSLEELQRYVKKSGNRYFVMRHGEAENNSGGFLSSRADNPHHLTDRGRGQIREAARRLKSEKIDLIVSSDFVRSLESAEIVAAELGLSRERVVVDSRLGEVNHGDLNLCPIEQYYGYWSSWPERFFKNLPNGENFTEVKRRMGQCLYDLEKRHERKNILIISHESPIWLLFAAAAGADLPQTITLRGGGGDIFFANAEVRRLSFIPLPHNGDFDLDLHRPFIDELELIDGDGRPLRRVKEVVDVWFDSGAMPFAQDHYPFENRDRLEGPGYPAEYIAEAIDQTRGWFYTLLAIGVLLNRGTSYRNVICLGHILDREGKKMSKSLGNVVDPWLMIDKYGADALRFWMYSVNQPGDSKNFDERGLNQICQKVFNPLLNVVRFYELYAPPDGVSASVRRSGNILDRWIIARLNQTAARITGWLNDYKITEAARSVREFILDLSQWYLRRSRERCKSENPVRQAAALSTLRFVLREFSKLLAPFVPFVAEDIFKRLGVSGDPDSIHLADWPEAGVVDGDLIGQMAVVRDFVSLGLEERQRVGLPVRQPLPRLILRQPLAKPYLELVKEAVNVKEVAFNSLQPEALRLETTISEALRLEGEWRELLRRVQDFRKEQKLQAGEKISLSVSTDKSGEKLVRRFEKKLKKVGSLESISVVAGDAPGWRFELRK